MTHQYGKNVALRDVSFDLNGNRIVGLLGSNGAGKSTCMNIICGVFSPTKGDVLLNGESIREHPLEAKRYLGYLPQTPPVYPEFTVDEYLEFCAKLRGVPSEKVRSAVERAKEMVDVSHFSSRLIGALSGGYRQRVAIAQAVIHEPKFVVLDEPTNGLDPVQVLEVRGLIRDVAKTATVLISTHVMSEVEALCEEILMIEGGVIVFRGSVSDFADIVPTTAAVAKFRGVPKLADVESIPGVQEVETISEGRLRLSVSDTDELLDHFCSECVRRDLVLEELFWERSSLEDVFAKLSQVSSSARTS